MPPRVTALFLALVLLWSGLSTVEAPHEYAPSFTGQPSATVLPSGQTAADDGSVEHHHLDDLPSQAQNHPPTDPPTDTPVLPPAPLKPAQPALAMELPGTLVWVAARAPFLAGPLRPPCTAARMA